MQGMYMAWKTKVEVSLLDRELMLDLSTLSEDPGEEQPLLQQAEAHEISLCELTWVNKGRSPHSLWEHAKKSQPCRESSLRSILDFCSLPHAPNTSQILQAIK